MTSVVCLRLTLEGPMMPLFRSDATNATSTSRRLSNAMSSAAVTHVDADQLAGIGYTLALGATSVDPTDWAISERSFEEAMRASTDVPATPA